MGDVIEAVERATARLAACDGSRLDELAAAVEERAAAIERLTAQPPATADEVGRVMAVLKAGETAVARLRGFRSQWREELEETDRARRYAAELQAGVARARGRLDVAG